MKNCQYITLPSLLFFLLSVGSSSVGSSVDEYADHQDVKHVITPAVGDDRDDSALSSPSLRSTLLLHVLLVLVAVETSMIIVWFILRHRHGHGCCSSHQSGRIGRGLVVSAASHSTTNKGNKGRIRRYDFYLMIVIAVAASLILVGKSHVRMDDRFRRHMQKEIEENFSFTRLQHEDDNGNDYSYDCHGLGGMKVLINRIHLEGNLGDELETAPLLQELKRCGIHVTAALSDWQPNIPQRLSSRSVREHGYIDKLISVEDLNSPTQDFDLFDATIMAPGPSGARKGDVPIDIYFGGTLEAKAIKKQRHLLSKASLLVVREPASYRDLLSEFTANLTSTSTSSVPTFYMMGDLANSYEPAWSAVEFWEEHYKRLYPNVRALVYARTKNWDNVVQIDQQTTNSTSCTLQLKPLKRNDEASTSSATMLPPPFFLLPCHNTNKEEVLFVSNSPVEDGELWNSIHTLQTKIPGFTKDQFLMLDTIEQMIALARLQTVKEIYTDRYHPGVIGYRFHKTVHLLDLYARRGKMLGLQQLMQEHPNPGEIQKERIPKGFQLLRDTLRMLRERRMKSKT